MLAREHAAPAAKGDHRRLQQLRELAHLLAGVHGPAAHHDHRRPRLAQDRRRTLHRVEVDRGRLRKARLRRRAHRHAPVEDVPGHGERHRARPAGRHLEEGLADEALGVGRAVDALGPLGDAAHHRQLVGQLVQVAHA